SYGGYFQADSLWGVGVYAKADGDVGTAIQATTTGENGYGVYSVASGADGRGVVGSGAQWDFYANGSGGNYGPFTGAHEVLFDVSMPEYLQPGWIVSSTGKNLKRTTENGAVSISSTLPTVILSSTANDPAVFGVVVREGSTPRDHWYDASGSDRFGVVNGLGDGRVWVTNINGNIKNGDYITTSPIPGYGQKQDDDLLHSYTLGKATETIDWDSVTNIIEIDGWEVKAYLLAVVYVSG
ncbi:MAG TPA: hypothetical protein PLV45_17375, partial [bacterium]|nr:hypothetical protein [bacterium]